MNTDARCRRLDPAWTRRTLRPLVRAGEGSAAMPAIPADDRSPLADRRANPQLNDLCRRKTRFSRPIADSTIRFRHGVEVAAR
jgi:hypothetical protein